MANADTYALLAAPFERTFLRQGAGGTQLEYLTGEQVVTRLNRALGPAGWSFRLVEHGIHPEADECWALAELAATIDGATVTRQQFGSQRVNRSRSSGAPIDLGFDLKGAATDALKKCASLIGVGLYLYEKEPPQPAKTKPAAANGVVPGLDDCEDCGEPLKETKFKDGTSWSPSQLAAYGRRKYHRILCMSHYREATAAARKAEERPPPTDPQKD